MFSPPSSTFPSATAPFPHNHRPSPRSMTSIPDTLQYAYRPNRSTSDLSCSPLFPLPPAKQRPLHQDDLCELQLQPSIRSPPTNSPTNYLHLVCTPPCVTCFFTVHMTINTLNLEKKKKKKTNILPCNVKLMLMQSYHLLQLLHKASQCCPCDS